MAAVRRTAGQPGPVPATKRPAARPAARQPAPEQSHARLPSSTSIAKERSRNTLDDARDSCIQVVVRCRGRSTQEIREDSPSIVTLSPTKGNDVTLTTTPQAPVLPPVAALGPSLSPAQSASVTKTYPFDHVFGPDADQGLVYNEVVAPIVDEVLTGYACTVFAYGQTGTGKTYTMEGDLVPSLGTFSPQAGVIPRTLYRLFHILERDHTEFAVRVSFVELYNEELRDLNAAEISAPSSQNQPMARATGPARQAFVARSSMAPPSTGQGKSTTKEPELKIFDDNAKRGVVIQGLEETLITSAAEGIKVLTRGSQRRQSAATQCNDQSSRSHSIFTITVHIKETASVGAKGASEDLLKIGKLNLVDLAGSENVGRSGAEKGRAREAGMINQSLLTLGRVINALVERNAHVPYRESKLTRLLQDSLGGRTKTCIIATISPAKVNLEETLSTLDYALRAKTIQNRPEINQRMTKAALLSQYSIEIERLKADLLAAREKNGIFLSTDSWTDMSSTHEARRLALEEAQRTSDLYDMQLRTTREQFEHSLRLIGTREAELEQLMSTLDRTNADLAVRSAELDVTRREVGDEVVLRKENERARIEWKGWARKAIDDTEGLRAKIARKQAVERANLGTAAEAEATFGSTSSTLRDQLDTFEAQQRQYVLSLRRAVVDASKRAEETSEAERRRIAKGKGRLDDSQSNLEDHIDAFTTVSSNYANAIDASRSEYIADACERAGELRTTCEERVQGLLSEWEGVVSQSLAAFKTMTDMLELSHASAIANLERNVQAFEARRTAEQVHLQAENERLTAQNAALTALLAQQRDSAASFETSLLASITSQFAQYRQTTSMASESGVEAIRASAQAAHEAAHLEARNRAEEDEKLAAVDLGVLATLTDQQKRMAELKVGHEQTMAEATAEGARSLHDFATSLEGHIAAHEGALGIYVEHAESEAETYRASAAIRRQSVHEASSALAQDVYSTLGSAYDGWSTLASSVQSTSAVLVEELDDLASTSQRLTGDMSTLLAALRAPVLSTDLPTGATPKKRIWPDATAPDSLDSLSREALLAQLRGSMAPAPTTTHHPLNVSIPAPTKLEIPLGVATGKAGQAVRRSVLGEKAPNTALVAPVTVATMRR